MPYRDDLTEARLMAHRDALAREADALEVLCEDIEEDVEARRSQDAQRRFETLVGSVIGFFVGLGAGVLLLVLANAAMRAS